MIGEMSWLSVPVISDDWGNVVIVIATVEKYPWLFDFCHRYSVMRKTESWWGPWNFRSEDFNFITRKPWYSSLLVIWMLLYQGSHNRFKKNDMLWNIESTERCVLHMYSTRMGNSEWENWNRLFYRNCVFNCQLLCVCQSMKQV